jgi:hypothetical protein
MVIKVLYSIFLGALVVLFVGWAMAALYPTPQWETEYPTVQQRYESVPRAPTAQELEFLSPTERKAKLQEYEAKSKEAEARESERQKLQAALQTKRQVHDRNVSLISLLVSVIVVVMAVGSSVRLPVISEGLLLGGLFTLIYSIGWSFLRSPKSAVIPVGVGLIITLALGYRMFVRGAKK